MVSWGAPALAFVVAAGVSLSELITSEYARTHFLLWKSRSLYAYSVIYGLLGLFFMVILDVLIAEEIVKLEGIGLENPWVQAVVIGVTIKAFLHIRLFNVNAGSVNFPVGVETLVQIFEPWLLRNIELDHFNASRALISPRAQKYNDIDQVKSLITENIPATFKKQEKAALNSDLAKTQTITEAMEIFLYYLGKESFDRVFPL